MRYAAASRSGGESMTADSIQPRTANVRPVAVLLGGGLVVGSLDIAYAIIFSAFRGFGPVRVLQSVAAGVLGRPSYQGGIPTALLGLALHYFIALMIVIVYWAASRVLPLLVRQPVICGAIYGLCVY